jgi:hypothetical protein
MPIEAQVSRACRLYMGVWMARARLPVWYRRPTDAFAAGSVDMCIETLLRLFYMQQSIICLDYLNYLQSLKD